ncbi:hypothetical protein Goshw_026071, partial [Gossypium schwendimanii]|nr:hypothetical protein [Gossypium schwendimanii]
QSSLQKLKEIWDQWNNEVRQLFYSSYGDLSYLLDIKGDSKCIPWKNLKDKILAHPDTKKKVDVFALSIYDLVIFPKALGHVDGAVTDLFDQLDKRVTPVLVILVKTFRSLNTYRRAGEVDSSDVRSYYSHGSIVISGKLIKSRIKSSLKTIHH